MVFKEPALSLVLFSHITKKPSSCIFYLCDLLNSFVYLFYLNYPFYICYSATCTSLSTLDIKFLLTMTYIPSRRRHAILDFLKKSSL